MCDPRRIQLTTLSFTARPDNTLPHTGSHLGPVPDHSASRSATVRLDLTLFDPDERNFPEFNYCELLESRKRSNVTLSSFEEEEPNEQQEVSELAKKLEEKYGGRPKEKLDRIQDLIDIGDGYDEEDSFIDNSEAYDEFVPSSLTTKHGGFYINSGVLQFRTVSETESGEEPGQHEEVKDKHGEDEEEQPEPEGRKRKLSKKHKLNGAGEPQRKRCNARYQAESKSSAISEPLVESAKKTKKKKKAGILSVTSELKKLEKQRERLKQDQARASPGALIQSADQARASPGALIHSTDQARALIQSTDQAWASPSALIQSTDQARALIQSTDQARASPSALIHSTDQARALIQSTDQARALIQSTDQARASPGALIHSTDIIVFGPADAAGGGCMSFINSPFTLKDSALDWELVISDDSCDPSFPPETTASTKSSVPLKTTDTPSTMSSVPKEPKDELSTMSSVSTEPKNNLSISNSVPKESKDKLFTMSSVSTEPKNKLSTTPIVPKEHKNMLSTKTSVSKDLKDEPSTTPSVPTEPKNKLSTSNSVPKESKDVLSTKTSVPKESKNELSTKTSVPKESKNEPPTKTSVSKESKNELSTKTSVPTEPKNKLSTSPIVPQEHKDVLSTKISVPKESKNELSTTASVPKESKNELFTTPSVPKESKNELSTKPSVPKESKNELSTKPSVPKESKNELSTTPSVPKESKNVPSTKTIVSKDLKDEPSTTPSVPTELKDELSTTLCVHAVPTLALAGLTLSAAPGTAGYTGTDDCPEVFPSDVEESVSRLLMATKTSEGESKSKFYTPEIKNILLEIDGLCRKHGGPLRSKVFSHLCSFLPCSKKTLQQRVNRLRNSEEEEMEQVMKTLSEAIGKSMPEQILQWKATCEANQSAIAAEDELKDGSEKKNKGLKKFKWSLEIRESLGRLLKLKLQRLQREHRGQDVEQCLRSVLDSDVKPLWPKGWMTSSILLKETRKLLHQDLILNNEPEPSCDTAAPLNISSDLSTTPSSSNPAPSTTPSSSNPAPSTTPSSYDPAHLQPPPEVLVAAVARYKQFPQRWSLSSAAESPPPPPQCSPANFP